MSVGTKTNDVEFGRINRFASEAYGRYKAGYSLSAAVEGACCGHRLDPILVGLVESQVLASICRDAHDEAGALDLVAPKLEYVRGRGDLYLPVLDRARAGSLYIGEAAILAAAAHHDKLWDLLAEIVEVGKGLRVGPANAKDPDLAKQQNRLSKQIANAPLDARIAAVIRARSGDFDSGEFAVLAAATICKEIYDALAQVRFVVVVGRARS